MFRDMEKWTEIRRRVLVEGVSIRQIQRETGLHFETVKRILAHPSPPEFACPPRPSPKIGAFRERIAAIIESDKALPKKQRHTAKRLFEVLQEEGYQGGYTQVKEAVRELRRTSQEVFVPLAHRPGEAQVDFGEALVKMAGELRKAHFFAMALPYSDAMFIVAYPKECLETFQDGHVRAFEFFGGAPTRISYDNARTSVTEIIGAHARKLTRGFLELQSYYLFEEHFCQVRRPNEKGVVENVVKFARQNYFVPVPKVKDFAELNTYLAKRCAEDLERQVRGKGAPKKARLEEDRAAFLPLPAAPFEAFRTASTWGSRLSLVRFQDNDYSIPVRYAHHSVLAKGYVDRVCICINGEVIAEHVRLWGKEGVAFEPVHYLELLERKPGALDHARPLEGWELPACFAALRQRLEQDEGAKGTREFIRVLRLLEKYPVEKVSAGIDRALGLGRCNRDVVAQFLYPDNAVALTFPLDGRPQLQGVYVAPPDVAAYAALTGGVR